MGWQGEEIYMEGLVVQLYFKLFYLHREPPLSLISLHTALKFEVI